MNRLLTAILIYLFATGAAFPQAALLPNAKQTFLSNTGVPLSGGTVTSYVPGSTTKKTTWSDYTQSSNNPNPVTLDSAGRAVIFGQGAYRQVVKDSSGNTIWDSYTDAYGSSSPSGATGTDTAPVGTILPFSGFTPPTNWLFAYGQALSRTTYSDLYDAITTSHTSVSCTNGSATLTGFADTSQFPIGAPIEASCITTGTTIVSITSSSSIVVSNTASSTTTVTATVFPWGNGNGSSTFNVPDLRGRVLAAPDSMGGTNANRLSATTTISTTSGLPTSTVASASGLNIGMVVVSTNVPAGTTISAISGTTVTLSANASATASGTTVTFYSFTTANTPAASGGAKNQTLVTSEIPAITPAGTIGGSTVATVAQGTAVADIPGGGSGGYRYTDTPGNLSANGFTFTGTAFGGGLAHTILQPTLTMNYMIKAAPNTTGAGGVVSWGGLFGDIATDSTLQAYTVGTTNYAGIADAADATMLANISGSTDQPTPTTNTQWLDYNCGSSAQGSVLYRGASTWDCLAPGLSGYVLSTNGAGANPSWIASGLAPPVSSVFGRTGAIVATSGDYSVGLVTGAAPIASPTFTGTVTGPNYAVTGSTIPANGMYLSAANTVGFATNSALRTIIGPAGSFTWQATRGPVIVNTTPSGTQPTLVPDGSTSASGIGASSAGQVSIISNSTEMLNADSVAGVTVATPSAGTNNTQIATTAFVQTALTSVTSVFNCTDAGSTGYVLYMSCPGLTEPFAAGQTVSFTAPINAGLLFQLSGSLAQYNIYNPTGTGLLNYNVLAQASDIKKGSVYRLRWSGTYWQLVTPPLSYTESTLPLTATYLQNAESSTTALTASFQFEVFNNTSGAWQQQYGQITQELFNNTAYIDGVSGQSLTAGQTYFVYSICVSTCASVSDVKMDFVSRYFTSDSNNASFDGYISGTTLTITSAVTGTVNAGQTLTCTGTCTGFVDGSYVVSGAGVNWLIHGTTNVGSAGTPVTFAATRPKYFFMNGAPGRPIFIDGEGNRGQLLGMLYVPSTGDVKSYFVRSDALAAGGIPGNTVTSSVFSVFPQQVLTSVTTPASPVTQNTVSTTYTELNTDSRTLVTLWEWKSATPITATGYFTCTAVGNFTLKITMTGLWTTPSPTETTLLEKPYYCPATGVPISFEPTVSWPWVDGPFLIKFYGKTSTGTADVTFWPTVTVFY